MKRFYFLLLVATFSLNLFCQQEYQNYVKQSFQYRDVTESAEWEEYRRMVYAYDSLGHLYESKFYWWSNDTGNWYIYYRHDYYYDSIGNRTDHYDYEWSRQTNEWLGQHHDKYIYDSLGNAIEDIRWASDPGVSELVEYWRHQYAYDSAGNEIEEIKYLWNYTSEWVNNSRVVSSYDTNGFCTESITYKWDQDSSDWKLIQRSLFNYDAEGFLMERVKENWDSLETWVKCIRYKYAYDVDGNAADFRGYTWDNLNNKWVEDYHSWSTYVIDITTRNILEHFRYSWWLFIETGDTITSEDFCTFAYDDAGRMVEKIEYQLTEPNLSAKDISLPDNSLLVFPNPFTHYTTLILSEKVPIQRIELLDIHGRFVGSIDNVNNNSVTIQRENLPSGIYFLRIHSDDIYIKKVIIR